MVVAAHVSDNATYRRRTPKDTVLYQLVQSHLPELLQTARERSEHGYGYPDFVVHEFESFLDCGLLRRGFVRVACTECPRERLVAFSCKRRSFCPSCTGRRMANTAAHLVDNVLPNVPYRQWVLSFPRRVRFLFAKHHDLQSQVLSRALKKIFAWQRRGARRLGVPAPMCGAVTFCQRFGSLLNLNCHFHSLLPDGVFTYDEDDDVLQFVPLLPPADADVERLLLQIARMTEKLVAGYLAQTEYDDTDDTTSMQLESVFGEASRLQAGTPPTASDEGALSAFTFGYSLHAARTIAVDDTDDLEQLCRYGARAPISNDRLSVDERGQVHLRLSKRYYDGRTELVMPPVMLLRKLAALVPGVGSWVLLRAVRGPRRHSSRGQSRAWKRALGGGHQVRARKLRLAGGVVQTQGGAGSQKAMCLSVYVGKGGAGRRCS